MTNKTAAIIIAIWIIYIISVIAVAHYARKAGFEKGRQMPLYEEYVIIPIDPYMEDPDSLYET